MAAGTLPVPGSQYGPCLEVCEHRDCAQTRQMAATLCVDCSQPIGYDRAFYQRSDDWRFLVHAYCAEVERGA